MVNKFFTFKSNFPSEIKYFSEIKKDIFVEAEMHLDRSLEQSLQELKSLTKDIVQNKIRIKNEIPDNQNQELATPKFNIPKAKNDLVKYLFDVDIKNSGSILNKSNPKTINDLDNTFVIKNNLFKVWQSVSDSSSYLGERHKFSERLKKGIFIDSNSGKLYKLRPQDVKAEKAECSKTSGGLIADQNKFEAYKNSPNIKRRSGDSVDQRVVVWTMTKESTENALRNAISVDEIVKRVMENDFDTASSMIKEINSSGELNETLRKIDNIKSNKDLTPDIAIVNALNQLIRNLKIEKTKLKGLVRYTLFSTYDDNAENSQLFFEELRKQIFLWKVSNENKWVNAIVKGITRALQRYHAQAKIIVQ